eukprot:g51066.t1
MDVSVLTAYKSELRRVATILKDKDHVVKKRKRAEPEEEQPQKFYLVATFRWAGVPQGGYLSLGRTRAGDRGILVAHRAAPALGEGLVHAQHGRRHGLA